MKTIIYFAVCCVLMTSCGMEAVKNARTDGNFPKIYPDYVDVTVPAQIAPLNFAMADDAASLIDVVATGEKGGNIHVQGEYADFDEAEWKELLQQNIGSKIWFEVSAKTDGGWTTFRKFSISVSGDEIDYGIAYRKLAPGYEVFSKMGIYERNLSNFDETAVLENTQFDGCLNCHEFNKCNPEGLTMHIRGDHSATLIRTQGGIEALNTKTDSTLGFCVYPYWHPSGKFIVYSTNTTRQMFHSMPEKIIEVFDLESDLQVYDIQKKELILSNSVMLADSWETYPTFSPDGKTLYFCTAPKVDIPSELKEVRYSLCKASFNSETGKVGEDVDTLVSVRTTGKSVTFPKPSYDGRYLMYTLCDYGCFSIWHHEADLFLLDLKTGESRALSSANSSDTDSYHNWSTNSRWFVFSSRRDDGQFTRLYLSHIGADGKESKPFMLPQKNPKKYYAELMLSYNVPEFVTAPIKFDRMDAVEKINSAERTALKVRR